MTPKHPQIYLGYDSRTSVAFEVARSSIAKRTDGPVSIMPLRLPHLGMLTRPIENRDGQLWCPISDAPMSTEFAISRFCVPFLQSSGWALFADCDIVCHSDIRDLFALADNRYAVMVVKHDHARESAFATAYENQPKHTDGLPFMELVPSLFPMKMDGQRQTYYKRKNWSSVVLWNLDHPANARFTLDDLNTKKGRDLHRFYWLEDDEIGELPQEWNWLINVTPGKPEERGIWHLTLGGPWFKDWSPSPHDETWLAEASNLLIPLEHA